MSDDLLDRIDATIAGWETRPESWLPGDPLYDEPRGATWDEQTIRPMVEEFLIAPTARMRCQPCQVSWQGSSACFVCGEDRPPLPGTSSVYELLVRMGRIPRPTPQVEVRVAVDVSRFQRAMDAVAETISREFTASIDALVKRLMPTPAPPSSSPPPLAVDGNAYHARIRARARRTRRNR